MSSAPQTHRSQDPASPRRESGHTLVEMLVVVLILGIMASMAQTASGNSDDYRLDLLETQVRDANDMAKALAAATRTAHGLVFDVDEERMAIVDEDGELATDPLRKSGYLIDFKDPSQPTGLDLVSAEFGDGANIVYFDPQGLPLSGGDLKLSCKDAERTLSFDPVTGEISDS